MNTSGQPEPTQKESNMKRTNILAVLGAVSLLAATTAWAGGAACTGKDSDASSPSHACPYTGAKSAQASEVGGKCDMHTMGAMANGQTCTIGANQMVYSFAVPTAECDHCAASITKALMDQKGIHCAHVDLKNRVAYIVADKKMDKNALAKCIKDAGFKNSYRGQGKAVQAEFTKMMTASTEKGAACCAVKTKEKV
jgi:copper chaperone CopZ